MQLRDKIVFSTLKLAETTRWSDITIEDIAKSTKTTPAIVSKEFPTKLHILDSYNKLVDTETRKNVEEISLTGSVREKLFEVLMIRFDILNKNKIAISMIYNDTTPFYPVATAKGIISLLNSMDLIREVAGINDLKPLKCLKTKILGVIFMKSFLVWLKDESLEMPKTMARLDQDLSKIERLQNFIG